LLNQSSANVSHKDIAARQAGSSIFPWQQDQALGRPFQDVVETPLKRRGTSLWEAHEETPIKPSQRMSCLQSPAGSSQQMEQLKTLNQVEQKLKQMTEEMSCQRHNAESCKRALEQKLKEQERVSQKELSQLQGTHQALEQQLDQTRTKLTQELQQSKKDLNVLQADMEKTCFQKNQIMKELEEQKQKLLRAEQNLQACQSKEHDVRKKMEELQKEKNTLTVQLDQGSRRLTQLEEEKKNTEQNLKRTQGLFDDLKGKIVQPNKSDLVKCVFFFLLLLFVELLFSVFKAKSEGQTEELKKIQSKLEHQSQTSVQELSNMKKTLDDAESKNERLACYT
ncbi:unnamed protein product, partial [Tetraodon nigroviridis]